MHPNDYRERFVDLMPETGSPDEQRLREALLADDLTTLAGAERHFAVAARRDRVVRLARTIGRPMRYFLAKRFDGPHLVVAERMSEIRRFCAENGLIEQFHPTYTRMVPAHHVVELTLTGCPDPNPVYRRFFTPSRNALPADVDQIGRRYIEAADHAVQSWLARQPAHEPVGVAFSGGIDSTAILILLNRAMAALGRPRNQLRAFTLTFGPEARDARQALETARHLGLHDVHEVIPGDPADLDLARIIRIAEDYRPIDIQCAAMNFALLSGIRRRYPDWRLIADGDGGDENLKDYPLEGTDVTTTSVLNNLMLYHEGWGVNSIKHSLTFSGGLSRSYTRTFMPARQLGFEGFSPFTLPSVIAVSEGIPFVVLTEYDAEKLYALKGQVVAAGIRHVAGIDMPVAGKRRFQEGALPPRELEERLPLDKPRYRRVFDALWEMPASGRSATPAA